nr:zinc metalloprotease HtpX [Mesorhizobium sp.]
MNEPLRLDRVQQLRSSARNTLHTWLLGTASLLLLTATAYTLAGGLGIVYAIIFGAVTTYLARRISPRMVLQMYKAQPVSRASFPVGVDIVETLARRAGLANPPSLYVVPSKLMNAFAVGRREDSAIAITDALARGLTVRELAGVLAHEMSHIANEDLKVMAFADMVSRFTSLWSTFGIFALFFNVFGMAGGGEAMVPWPAVALLVFAPTLGGLLQLALSRTREFDADLRAAVLTGDPDGLASALRRLEKVQGMYWESLMLPGSRTPVPSVLRTHPATEERVARLMALKHGAAVDFGPDGPAMPPIKTRPSIVPHIRARHPDIAAFVPLEAMEMPGAPDGSACPDGLVETDGRPRIRPLRGGIYF